jgi:hypothetical protein
MNSVDDVAGTVKPRDFAPDRNAGDAGAAVSAASMTNTLTEIPLMMRLRMENSVAPQKCSWDSRSTLAQAQNLFGMCDKPPYRKRQPFG